MDIDEPRTQKFPDMPSRGAHKHCCKVCNKTFASGRALGGHMTNHRHAVKQPKSTSIPHAIAVDVPVSLLDPRDEKPSLPSLETHCLHYSKEFSSCRSLMGNMRMHSEKNVMAKPDKEPETAGLMEALPNANGDRGHNVVLFSPVKRKRSKRGMPVLDSEMNAAAALLMLAEHPNKTSVSEGCCGEDKDGNVSKPEVLKQVNLNAFDQLIQSDEFANNTKLTSDKNSAYEGLYEHHQKKNSLNLAAFVPNKMVLLNVFDHGLDADAEFMTPGADISVDKVNSGDLLVAANMKGCHCKVCGKFLVSGYALGCHMRLHCEKENSLNLVADISKQEVVLNVFGHRMDVDAESMKPGAYVSVDQLKSSVLSSAVNIKRHQCKVCGKLLRSGKALGGHMRLHYVRKCNLGQGVADCPDSVMMEEQMQKLELNSPIFYRWRPHSHGSKI